MSNHLQFNFSVSIPASFDFDMTVHQILSLKNIDHSHFEFTFIDDEKMIQLHKTYLQLDHTTDILTFNLGSTQQPDADIYICVDQANRQAQEYGQSIDNELKLLIIHGILHCIGYDDTMVQKKLIMDQEQTRILRLL